MDGQMTPNTICNADDARHRIIFFVIRAISKSVAPHSFKLRRQKKSPCASHARHNANALSTGARANALPWPGIN